MKYRHILPRASSSRGSRLSVRARSAFHTSHLGLVAALGFAAACGTGAGPADGSVLFVPAAFHEARSSMGHQRHIGASQADGGRLECRSCHALEVDGFASPGTRPCQRCHEDHAHLHHGPTDGGTLPDGGTVTCLTCHAFAAAGVQSPATPWVCLSCHAEPIGAAVAVRAHAAACFFCHVPHREPFTQVPDCRVCHRVADVHGVTSATATERCGACHARHAPAREASKQCLACHSDPKRQTAKVRLVTQTALFEGHPSCGTCHVPHRFSRESVKPCGTCHEKPVVLARDALAEKNPSGHARCTDCHDPHRSTSPKACESCHADVENRHPAPEGHPKQSCAQCHPAHQALPGLAVAKDCVACHEEPQFAGLVHGRDGKTSQSLTCGQCHPRHGFGEKMTDWSSCKACHPATLAAATKMKKGGHSNCEDCHEGLPHKPSLLDMANGPRPTLCVSCHERLAPPKGGHLMCRECHETHSGAKLKGCVDCHRVGALPGLHAADQHQRCETCHRAHGSQPLARRSACFSGCHEKEGNHEPTSERCHGCHLFRLPKPGDPVVQLKKQ